MNLLLRDTASAPAAMTVMETAAIPIIRDGVDMAKLVGRPHLFGRIKPLRHGFMVEPVANLVLQPDGRVTGHGHPNEGSWSTYEHGEVPASEAFAFISGGNGYIPSSTWTQSIGDMPVSHFCDEPEVSQAAQRLCLLPQDAPKLADDVVFLVASCLRFHERTVPALLEQLRADGIRSARIGQKGRVCHRWFTRGQRPPGLCDQRYTWTHLFAAVQPATGRSFALVLPEVSTVALTTKSSQGHAGVPGPVQQGAGR